MFAGLIKVTGGPHVAQGPEAAQAWSKTIKNNKNDNNISNNNNNKSMQHHLLGK